MIRERIELAREVFTVGDKEYPTKLYLGIQNRMELYLSVRDQLTDEKEHYRSNIGRSMYKSMAIYIVDEIDFVEVGA